MLISFAPRPVLTIPPLTVLASPQAPVPDFAPPTVLAIRQAPVLAIPLPPVLTIPQAPEHVIPVPAPDVADAAAPEQERPAELKRNPFNKRGKKMKTQEAIKELL